MSIILYVEIWASVCDGLLIRAYTKLLDMEHLVILYIFCGLCLFFFLKSLRKIYAAAFKAYFDQILLNLPWSVSNC